MTALGVCKPAIPFDLRAAEYKSWPRKYYVWNDVNINDADFHQK